MSEDEQKLIEPNKKGRTAMRSLYERFDSLTPSERRELEKKADENVLTREEIEEILAEEHVDWATIEIRARQQIHDYWLRQHY